MADVERDLGAKGPVIVTGYVFTEEFAAQHGPALARFFDMMAKAKKLISDDDAAFAQIVPLTGAKDAATQALLRKYYRQGVPTRPLQADEADAAAIFKVLAGVGGENLVGSAKEIDPGVFYSPAEAAPKK